MNVTQIFTLMMALLVGTSFSTKFELSSLGLRFLQHFRRSKRAILTELCPKLGCQNGKCKEVNKKITCDCDRNWTGSMCSIKCPQDCGQDGKCVLDVGGVPRCACTSLGGNCDVLLNRRVAPEEVTLNTLSPVDTKAFNQADVRENKVKYIPSDCSDIGFLCQNGGTCMKHITVIGNKLRAVHCQCPDGFYGDLCQNRCTLRCENQGSCHKDRASGKEMCLCRWEFKGRLCEERNDFFSLIKAL